MAKKRYESSEDELMCTRKINEVQRAKYEQKCKDEIALKQAELERVTKAHNDLFTDSSNQKDQYEHAIRNYELKLQQAHNGYEDGKVQLKKAFDKLMEDKLN